MTRQSQYHGDSQEQIDTDTSTSQPSRWEKMDIQLPGSKDSRFRKGDGWVWTAGTCSALILLLFATLLSIVFINGFSTYWANDIFAFKLQDQTSLFASKRQEEPSRIQLFTGNRDVFGLDYRWLDLNEISETSKPEDIVVLERIEKGNFIGLLKELRIEGGQVLTSNSELWQSFENLRNKLESSAQKVHKIHHQMSEISYEMDGMRLAILSISDPNDPHAISLEAQRKQHQQSYETLNLQLDELSRRLRENVAVFELGDLRTIDIAIADIVRAYRPNKMTAFNKLTLYAAKIGELLTGNPRESNSEGGLFPAIFGTVAMVLLMSIFTVPLGVIAAVYLREYAKDGFLVTTVRIAVNNLAGVPSIVYGIFGLGFFIYGIGGSIDQLFFSDRLPIPTFGTGGLLWASLTMSLLTVPVVIVSTEEGLNSVPQGVRDGSIALGATKLQTLTRVVLPMASPGILTGLILSIARAAGEVAPLMLVGVVKLAPSLPLDNRFPFFHLDRKFMHLGFHLFDVGFQSPNVEAAMPMVYVTTLLLLTIVLSMSFLAMYMRNKMKKRFTVGAF